MTIIVLSVVALVSLALNGALFYSRSKRAPKQESYECKELLQDLLAGESLVRVQRVAPSDVFLRSPRGEQ
jgi:hypothetical protein